MRTKEKKDCCWIHDETNDLWKNEKLILEEKEREKKATAAKGIKKEEKKLSWKRNGYKHGMTRPSSSGC